MTRIHHLDCATMCPAAAPWIGLVDRHAGNFSAHCLLIEDRDGLILVDTGFGTADVAQPGRLGPGRFLTAPRLDVAQTAIHQIRALGHDPADVRHILLTHLDMDHAGGLGDFPHAEVHLHAVELEAAQRDRPADRGRYRKVHWSHGPRWQTHAESGERWLGLERVRLIEGLDTEVVMLPLFGHSAGHSGFAVRTPDGDWLLHAGDAYLRHGELSTPRRVPAAVAGWHAFISEDRAARRANADALAQLAATHSGEVTVFCSHDPTELPNSGRS